MSEIEKEPQVVVVSSTEVSKFLKIFALSIHDIYQRTKELGYEDVACITAHGLFGEVHAIREDVKKALQEVVEELWLRLTMGDIYGMRLALSQAAKKIGAQKVVAYVEVMSGGGYEILVRFWQ